MATYEYLLNPFLLCCVLAIDYWAFILTNLKIKRFKKIAYDHVWVGKKYKFTFLSHYWLLPLFVFTFLLLTIFSFLDQKNMVKYYIYVTFFLINVIYIMICYLYCFFNKNSLFVILYQEKILTMEAVVSQETLSQILYNRRHTAVYLVLTNGKEIKTLYNLEMCEHLAQLFALKPELIV